MSFQCFGLQVVQNGPSVSKQKRPQLRPIENVYDWSSIRAVALEMKK